MRKLQILTMVVAVCFLAATGLAQSKRRARNTSPTDGRYRAKRSPWKGPTTIKALNMKLLTTLYGDVSNPNGVAVPDDVIQNFDLSPDGSTLVCAYFTATLIVWDTQTGVRKKVIEASESGFGDVAFSPDGAMFVTGPGNFAAETAARTITFWDAKTYKAIGKVVSGGTVQRINISPDGKSLAVVSYMDTGSDTDKTVVELWDVESKRLAAVQPAKGRSIDGSGLFVMSQVAFSPDGSKLATITKQTAEVWDIKTGELVQTLQGHQKDVTGVWFSPDGRFLVSTAEQQLSVDKEPVGELIIWNALTGEKVKTLPGYTYATFSPDGKLIASGNEDKNYSLIDVSTGSVISRFPQIGALRFSRNGRRAANYDDLVVIRTWQMLK
jgi:WD40 repeat protein